MTHIRIDLATGTPVGDPGPLPAELVGLDDATLADLPAALDPVPEQFAGVGFWPVDYQPLGDPIDPRAKTINGYALDADAETRRVASTPTVRDLTPEEVAALPPIPVPISVTMRQARLALLSTGILDAADAAIDGMEGPQGKAARIEWEYATELRRDHPLVAGLGEGLGLDDEAIDALFVGASQIQ